MMDIIPSSIVGGIFNKNTLKRYVIFNIILTTFFIPSAFFSIQNYGLKGAAIALIIFYTIRSLFGFNILYRRYELQEEN